MPQPGHILALGVGPSTTAIYGRRQVLPDAINKTPLDVYEVHVSRLVHAFQRGTDRYDPRLKRLVPGPLVPIIDPLSGTFDTGILLYVAAWWLSNVTDSGVVLSAGDLQLGIRHKGQVQDVVSQFFRQVAGLGEIQYTPDPRLKIEQRDYLRHAINAWLQSPRGIWHAATNAGKTFLLGALAGALADKRFLITVPHTRSALAVQGADDFRKMGHRSVGLVKGGPLRRHRIVWAAMSTVVKRYAEDPKKTLRWINGFDVVAKDECHEHSAREDALYRLMDVWARLGMSGTPLKGAPVHDATTVGTFGPVLYRIRNTDLIKRGFSALPHVYVITLNHQKQTFNSYQAFHRYIVKKNSRNQMIVRTAQLLRQLGHRVVISTSSVNPHAKELVKRLSEVGTAELYDGSLDPEKRKEMLIRLSKRETDYVVASRVFEVGVSENSISAIVFAGPMGKGTMDITVLQKAGRGLRLGEGSSRHIVIVDFQDHTQFGTGQARRRMEVWRGDRAFDLHIAEHEHHLHRLLHNHHDQWTREAHGRPPEPGNTISTDQALRSPFGD